MTREQPADECGSGEHDQQICAVAMTDHIGSATDRFVRRAVRGRPEISDQFIEDRIADTLRADLAASLPAWDMNLATVSLRPLRSARNDCRSDPAEFIASLAAVPIASLPRVTDSEIDAPSPPAAANG